MSRLTMKDVAERAGVDVSTVSLSLRDDPRISEKTKNKVKQIALEMGYSVNPLIAAWVRSRKKAKSAESNVSVGYLTSYPEDFDWKKSDHFQAIYQGLHNRFKEFGFHVSVFDLNKYKKNMVHLEKVLSTRNIVGLVFGPGNHEYKVSGLAWERYSMATIGYALKSPRVHRITEDHFLGMEMAFSRCRSIGGKRIGLALSKHYNSERRDRWVAAYLLECMKIGLHLSVYEADDKHELKSAKEWIQKNKPDVILTDNPENWRFSKRPTVCFAVTETSPFFHGVKENNIGIGQSTADALIALVIRGERGLPKIRKNIIVEPGDDAMVSLNQGDLEEMFPSRGVFTVSSKDG